MQIEYFVLFFKTNHNWKSETKSCNRIKIWIFKYADYHKFTERRK